MREVPLPTGVVNAEGLARSSGRATFDAEDFLAALIRWRPAFFDDALCREPAYEGVNFYPELGESTGPAKRVCAGCLVRDECLAFAVEHREIGVWGGTSDKERRSMRFAARRPAAPPPEPFYVSSPQKSSQKSSTGTFRGLTPCASADLMASTWTS